MNEALTKDQISYLPSFGCRFRSSEGLNVWVQQLPTKPSRTIEVTAALAPMSEVAGRLSIIEGASQLKSSRGGPGILISGVLGTLPAEVVIIGAVWLVIMLPNGDRHGSKGNYFDRQ